DPVERDAGEREDVQRPDRYVDAVQADTGAEDVLHVAERDQRERGDGGQDRERRSDSKQIADARSGPRGLFRRELDDLGERLHQPERPHTVRPVAILEPTEQLSLVPDQDREEQEHDQEDHERLDDLDPPRLEVIDVGERDHGPLLTSIVCSARTFAESAAMPSARNAVPAGTSARTWAVALSAVPF